MNKLTAIHTAYLNADIALKSLKITSKTDILTGKQWDIVETVINGRGKRWGDIKNQWVQEYFYNGTLDQCLAYLQSFAKNNDFYKGSDLNEIHHYETNK